MKNLFTSFICFFLVLFPFAGINAQPGADSLLNFIKQNESKSSLYLRKDDSIIARLNEDKLMPLASTVKILIAVEFAKQAAHDIFNPNQRVPLSEPGKYFIPNTDGNAHPNWISYERKQGHIINDSVSLMDIARGMTVFSSNANAEYLMDLLGFENINSNLSLLGLNNHTPVYPFVAALFLYQNPKKVNEDKLIRVIKKLSTSDYIRACYLIHRELKNDTAYKKQFRPQDLTLKMQEEWSDRLPASTTKEYVKLCTILNNRKYFDAKTYDILSKVLETVMENPDNQAWLAHAGMKSGSTPFVLTSALYATLKNGTKMEMALFFNDLSPAENMQLQQWMNDFELKVLTDEKFRRKMIF